MRHPTLASRLCSLVLLALLLLGSGTAQASVAIGSDPGSSLVPPADGGSAGAQAATATPTTSPPSAMPVSPTSAPSATAQQATPTAAAPTTTPASPSPAAAGLQTPGATTSPTSAPTASGTAAVAGTAIPYATATPGATNTPQPPAPAMPAGPSTVPTVTERRGVPGLRLTWSEPIVWQDQPVQLQVQAYDAAGKLTGAPSGTLYLELDNREVEVAGAAGTRIPTGQAVKAQISGGSATLTLTPRRAGTVGVQASLGDGTAGLGGASAPLAVRPAVLHLDGPVQLQQGSAGTYRASLVDDQGRPIDGATTALRIEPSDPAAEVRGAALDAERQPERGGAAHRLGQGDHGSLTFRVVFRHAGTQHLVVRDAVNLARSASLAVDVAPLVAAAGAPTATPTVTITPTTTVTVTPTATGAASPTATPRPTAAATGTPVASATAGPASAASPTAGASPTAEAATPTPTPSPTATPASAATATATATASPTSTPTASATATPTASPTASGGEGGGPRALAAPPEAGDAGGALGLVFGALEGPRLEADGGPAFRLTWSAATTNAGVPDTLTVQALNPDGSPNTGYLGTVQLTSTDPAASFAPGAPYTFAAGDSGSRAFQVAFATAASAQTVTVQDVNNAAAQVTSGPVAVAQTVLVASVAPTNPVLGGRVTFVVAAQDGQGNAVAGYQGTVALTSTWEGHPATAAVDWDPQAMQYAADLYTFSAADSGSHTFTPTITQDALVTLIATDAAQPSRTAQTGNLQVQDPAGIQGYGHGASPTGLKLQDGATLVAWLGGRGQLVTRRIVGTLGDPVWGPEVVAHQELSSSATIQQGTFGADSPSLVQLGGTVALFHVFADQSGQYWQLWVSTSADGGKSWQSPRQLTTDARNVERVQAAVYQGQAYVFWSRSGGDGVVHYMTTTDFATYSQPQALGQTIGTDNRGTSAGFGVAPAPGGGWALAWFWPEPTAPWQIGFVANNFDFPAVWFATSPDLASWSAATQLTDPWGSRYPTGLTMGREANGTLVPMWSRLVWPYDTYDFQRTFDGASWTGEALAYLDPWAPASGWANRQDSQPALVGGTTWAMGAMAGGGYGDDPFGAPDVGIPGGMVDLSGASFCPTGTCGQAGGPIDLATGVESTGGTDMAFGVRGGAATLSRAYTSAAGLGGRDGAFGLGWQWRWGVRAKAYSDGTVAVVEPDGWQTVYWRNQDGSYTPGTYSLDTLSASGGGWRLTRHDQTVLQFDGQGRLASETDRRGNQTSLAYGGAGATPSQVTFPGGRAMSISADGNGHVTQVQGPGGLATSYTYDGAGNLATATDAAGATTRYTYDGLHELLTVVDGDGHTVESNTYGTNGLVVQQQDARGQATGFGYAADGQGGNTAPNTATDPHGIQTQYGFDGMGRLLSRVVVFNSATVAQDQWAYDQAGHVLSHTDGTGVVTAMTYDGQGNVLTQTVDPGGLNLKTTYTYDAQNDVLTVTDPNNHTTRNAYDGQGDLTSVADALGHQTTYGYDPYGERTSQTDPNGHTTTYAYGAQGDLASATSPGPNPATTTFGYDSAGRLTGVVDANNHTTTMALDGMGRVTSTTDALGHTTSVQYDAVGNKVKVTDPNGHATTYAYNEANQLVGATDALGKATTYTVDADGNRTQMTDANGHATTYSYDGANRLAGITDALNHTTAFAYDADGRKTGATDPNGHVTSYGFDHAGRLITTTDALGKATAYGYDPASNRTSVTDPDGHQTSYAYDGANRLVTVTDPLNHATTTAYDSAGNRTAVTDPNNHQTQYGYDPRNRLTSVTDAAGKVTSYTLDAVGNRTAATDPLGHATTYAYDAANRLVTTTDALGHATAVAYDAAGNRTGLTDPNNHTTAFAYDADNRLTGVTDALGHTTTYALDAVGNRTGVTDANGHTTTYAFDAANRLTGVTDPLNRAATYTLDAAGNVTLVQQPNSTANSYVYDADNRLTGVDPGNNGGTPAIQYSYDPAGLRTSMADPTGTTTYAYDAGGRLTGVTAPTTGQVQYAYDPASELATLTYPSGHQVAYGYTARGQLASVTDWQAHQTAYAYDDAGRLAQIADPNGVT